MANLDIRHMMERCDIYVLDLGSFYYVGRTNNPKQRMMAHIAGTASNFTRQHKPIKIYRYYRNATPAREKSVACLMIKEKGAYRVRGWKWTGQRTTKKMLKIEDSDKWNTESRFLQKCRVSDEELESLNIEFGFIGENKQTWDTRSKETYRDKQINWDRKKPTNDQDSKS